MTNISIVMATYNGERHVREQLDSLARQTSLPFELVVTDDRSTDATLSIVEEFGRSAPFPVRIYRNNERLNFIRNFLHGASLCKGDWIAFCDQDDLWLDHKLEVVSDYISRHPDSVLIQHTGVMTDEKLVPTGVFLPDFRRDSVLPPLHETGFVREGGGLSGFAMVFRSDLLALRSAVRFPTGSYYEGNIYAHDRYIHFLATIFGTTVQISEPLVYYRRHTSAVSVEITNPRVFRKRNFIEHAVLRLRSLRTKAKEDTFAWRRRFEELADILAENAFGDPILARRAREASIMYRDRATLFAERGKLYSDKRSDRIDGFAKLIRGSAYRSRNSGGLGAPGFVSDVMKLVT